MITFTKCIHLHAPVYTNIHIYCIYQLKDWGHNCLMSNFRIFFFGRFPSGSFLYRFYCLDIKKTSFVCHPYFSIHYFSKVFETVKKIIPEQCFTIHL